MYAQPAPNGRYVDEHAASGEHQLAALMHLSMYGYVLFPFAFLVPLVIWLVKKDDSPYLDDHGREAVNFHISLLIYMLLSIPLMLAFGLGLAVLFIVVPLFWLILPAVAAIAASRGQYYRYPATFRLLK